ncbi:MAG TPA: lipoprotein [Rhizomicrobium sp.]|jgi:predicted small lipoprotein YifL|nr:lipoprotein [Rhizomicrobium sp.]
MILRLFLVLSLTLSVAACGTKSNLDLPNGNTTPKGQKDPSRPPHPIGQ